MQTLALETPLDMHLHFREGAMMELVAPLSSASFAGGVIMPNLVPPVADAERLAGYTQAVEQLVSPDGFSPLMTLFFRAYTREELVAMKDQIFAIKLYPQGVTTNSEGGVASLADMEPTLELMQELGIPLLIHGEDPGSFVMDREANFLPSYEDLAARFPKLSITMEHITTAAAVALMDRFDNLSATVTLQHLLITLDDVAGGLLDPHLFCKPIAKRPEDRDALMQAAIEAHPRLMFGSDSAPHPLSKKECCGCAAGCFTAPIALPLLAELFDSHDALDKLNDFVGGTARNVHPQLATLPAKTVGLEKAEMTIPDRYGDVVPMWAGRSVSWCLA